MLDTYIPLREETYRRFSSAFDLGQALITNLDMISLLFSFARQPSALLVQEIVFVDTVRSKVTSQWRPRNDLEAQPGSLHAYEHTWYMYTLTEEGESTALRFRYRGDPDSYRLNYPNGIVLPTRLGLRRVCDNLSQWGRKIDQSHLHHFV